MAVGGYDEDLLLNPFYKSFISKGKEIYNNAANNRWTICIPRKGTTSKSSFNRQCFETHILKPPDTGIIYTTLNGREVKIDSSFIVTANGFEEVRSIKILFEESFFNENQQSYHVLCIDNPLDSLIQSSSLPVIQLETLQNCNDFLWVKSSNKACRNRLNELIQLYNTASKKVMAKSLRQSVDAANSLFSRAMEVCLKESRFRKLANTDRTYMDNLKVAVETYVMDGIHRHVFKGVSSLCAEVDGQFNKTTRNLSDLQLSDLHVNPLVGLNIAKCKKIISNLNKFTTPLEKLYVLKLTIMAFSESSKAASGDEDAITTDDLLPALIFLMVKCQIPNWHANFTYMQNFHFSQSKTDEFQFYLASTEAAMEHIQSRRLDSMISMTHTQRVKVIDSLLQGLDLSEKQSTPSAVDIFFKKIRDNDVNGVLTSLKESAANITQITESLCHPLCSCSRCERILTGGHHDNDNVTVFSRDGIGCTALHQAAECGCEEIIYELIKNGAEVNTTNYFGSTPIHLAAQRGHHKCIVLLTHYGGDVNLVDSSSNTPLHLATANGHELCVDFLLSNDCETRCASKVDMNGSNEDGDVPLHIASRWGFGEIVLTLLKQGAKTDMRNNKDYTPFECALNDKIKEIFLEITSPSKETFHSLSTLDSSENISSGYVLPDSPTTSRRKKEFSNLLKAIADGNTELVRQKLGVCKQNDPLVVEPPPSTPIDAIEQLLCHPLCQCEKCALLQQKVVSEMVTINANTSNSEGVRPLHIASIHGFEDIVTILLKECAADPNCKTAVNQRTPLHLACQYNNIECVSLLLKNGARVNMKDNNGNTALHFCCTNGHIGPAILLLQAGANVQSLNLRGNTALHDAVRWDYLDIVKLLLHYKAPLNVTNKMSLTPLQYARGGEVCTLLQRASTEVDEDKETVDDEPRKGRGKGVKFDSNRGKDDLFPEGDVLIQEKAGLSLIQEKAGLSGESSNQSVEWKTETENENESETETETENKVTGSDTEEINEILQQDPLGDDILNEEGLDCSDYSSAANHQELSSVCGIDTNSSNDPISTGSVVQNDLVPHGDDNLQLSADLITSFDEIIENNENSRIVQLISEAIDDDDIT